MRLARLFRASPSDEPRIEPRDRQAPAGPANQEAASGFDGGGARADSSAYADSLVLDLIGGTADASSARFTVKTGDDTASTATDALFGSLYEQYCQALDSPLTPRADTWVPAPGGEDVSYGEQHQTRSRLGDGTISPIADVLGDIYNLEQAFGPMFGHSSHSAAVSDNVPEVLRLFAPPEYGAALSHKPGPILPSLVRREHHTLSIDSPVRPLNTPHSREQEPTR
ncbi:TagK domain-containing protein [Caballeronia sp. RCC_10]|uniref:TagK domain-containing protein n=1 Tax=Caballeronia sp. RCC_10 TaxID=3239227 RepID=UPI003524E401